MNQNMRHVRSSIALVAAISSLIVFLVVAGHFFLKWNTANYIWTGILGILGGGVGAILAFLLNRVTRTQDQLSVFISHSSQDAHEAEKLAEELRTRHIHPLLVAELIKPGSSIAAVMKEAIYDCDSVVLLVSEDIQARSFLIEDLKEAAVRNRPVIPALLKEVPVPESFRDVVPVNLAQNWDTGVQELVEAIRKNGKHFVCQQEMNHFAADRAQAADEELNLLVQRLKESLDPERVELLEQSQKLWEQFAQAQADFSSSEALGGSMRPLLYHSEYESLVRDRIARLRQELSLQGEESK